jgi:cytidylate kinase
VVITIDGPAGAGKSTVARAVAQRLGYRYVDTGLMYRELTAVAMARGVDADDGDALAALVDEPPPPGVDVRGEAVSARVSAVSRHPQVRARMRRRQRALARDAVLEGRDTGSIVCPDAEVKVYLTASLKARAARRAVDLGLGADEVGRTIAARDRGDAEQLAPAPDAHVIDTSGLTVAEAVDAVVRLVEAAA